MTMKTSVLKEVAALPGLSIGDLKTKWQELFDSDPPPYNKAFLIRRLAYRLQELTHGGLSEITKERLKNLASEEGDPPRQQAKTFQGDGPVTGTRLMREWKGVEHCVTVMENGFDYEGQKFRSLSAVARAITGTRWNGKLFFGLKKGGGYA
jgi:hypothetical protein